MARRRSVAFACAALAAPLAGCGGDSESSTEVKKAHPAKPQALTYAVTSRGKSAKIEGPATAKAGLVELTFQNNDKAEHSAQVVSVTDNHPIKEGLTAGGSWGEKGAPLPPWVKFHGGLGTVKAGESQTALLSLPPGKYAVTDIDANATFAALEVKGGKRAKVAKGDGTITATEYAFTGSGLKAGKAKVLITNAGKEPHNVLGAPLKKGKTLQDARDFFAEQKGDIPLDEARAFNTAIIDGGKEQLIELELAAGRYVMFCHTADRKGGPPHVAMGMISEVTVGP